MENNEIYASTTGAAMAAGASGAFNKIVGGVTIIAGVATVIGLVITLIGGRKVQKLQEEALRGQIEMQQRAMNPDVEPEEQN